MLTTVLALCPRECKSLVIGADSSSVHSTARSWLDRRTFAGTDFPLESLLAAKGTQRITVISPALDEESTVGAIVEEIRAVAGDQHLGLGRSESQRLAEGSARSWVQGSLWFFDRNQRR